MVERPARLGVALVAGVVAFSLLGAPVTMAAWGQQASFSVEHVQPSDTGDRVPVVHYANLSASGQRAVRAAIESPDGSHVVYGRGDWPPDFAYSDNSAPGHGLYTVAYRGEYYRLTTSAVGGFPFVYWLAELPFVAYGAVLGWAAAGTPDGDRRAAIAGVGAVVGVAFHALGPVFDFPVLGPHAFSELGVVGVVVLAAALLWERYGTSA